MKAQDLTLDPLGFKVKRGDTKIRLSAKEFSLLEYLLRNKNVVLSREQIISHIWNYDADVLPTTVEVHIKNLRDKIDVPFEKPLIQTIRGKGYTIGE